MVHTSGHNPADTLFLLLPGRPGFAFPLHQLLALTGRQPAEPCPHGTIKLEALCGAFGEPPCPCLRFPLLSAPDIQPVPVVAKPAYAGSWKKVKTGQARSAAAFAAVNASAPVKVQQWVRRPWAGAYFVYQYEQVMQSVPATPAIWAPARASMSAGQQTGPTRFVANTSHPLPGKGWRAGAIGNEAAESCATPSDSAPTQPTDASAVRPPRSFPSSAQPLFNLSARISQALLSSSILSASMRTKACRSPTAKSMISDQGQCRWYAR